MKRVIHFEIHVTNPEKAAVFYQNVFGWTISKWDGPTDYWLIKTGEGAGIDGGLLKRHGPAPTEDAPVTSFINTIDVENLEETGNKITANGGKQVVPKMTIPTVGWLAYFKDIDGNIFGIMQANKEAK